MDISCAFATSMDTPEHITLAERLGYARAWCYDSPALYPDVWMTLARAADRTSRIGLGPGVLIPSLRHVMTNAAAIAALAQLAPGRVVVAVGAGFTGRMTLGQRSLPWSRVAAYIAALRALLRGEEVAWEDAAIRMLHPAGFAPSRPIDVPVLVAADGPRGLTVARELGDGVFTAGSVQRSGLPWVARLTFGTVLDEGEDAGSGRALAAAGHAAAVRFHATYERGGIELLPGGTAWKERVEALPERTRHLSIHEGHLVGLNDLDQPLVTGQMLRDFGLALTAEEFRTRFVRWEDEGVTEIAYQPAGPDIPRELRAFATMAGL
ncbi:MAG: LLM class flavin-dependent oxidoreductase [Dehalococcoidia bacterium]